jgi:transcriptional regulator GlxA family with amidase domain
LFVVPAMGKLKLIGSRLLTPIRHVWEARTRRGAQLLRETGLTVGEVAFRCGFQTPFHFSRWVRELYGVPPRALRTKAWRR